VGLTLLIAVAAPVVLAGSGITAVGITAVGITAGTMPAYAAKLKVPRFVSLRFNTVYLRAGPGAQYPINWVYKRRGMPVEVIRDLENWRRVRDRWGTVGWIHVSNLSGKRTVLIDGAIRQLHDEPDGKAKAIAKAQPGVIAALDRCRKQWCRISVDRWRGWIRRAHLWGVYAGEKVD